MTRKRPAIVSVLLLALVAPIVVVATSPELRARLRLRWYQRELRSPDALTRRSAIARLVAREGIERDAIFPEVVAAAVMDVESRTTLVVAEPDRASGPTIDVFVSVQHNGQLRSFEKAAVLSIEQALTPPPGRLYLDELLIGDEKPLFKLTKCRALWVTRGDAVLLAVPLEGERGEKILAAVEERLRRGE